MVISVVLTALDGQPLHRSILELSNNLGKTRVTRLELADAMPPCAHDDGHAQWQHPDQLES